MPEPASAALRKLHEEATDDCLCGLPTCNRCLGQNTAIVALRNALPALADLVEAVEATHSHIDYEPECGECVALAALRERLGAKP